MKWLDLPPGWSRLYFFSTQYQCITIFLKFKKLFHSMKVVKFSQCFHMRNKRRYSSRTIFLLFCLIVINNHHIRMKFIMFLKDLLLKLSFQFPLRMLTKFIYWLLLRLYKKIKNFKLLCDIISFQFD